MDCSVWPTDITDFLDEVSEAAVNVCLGLFFFFLVQTHNKLELYKKLDLSHDGAVESEPQASQKSQRGPFVSFK